MPDLSTKTNEQLLARLGELDVALDGSPLAGSPLAEHFHAIDQVLREVGHIHIELARRTATGWRPL